MAFSAHNEMGQNERIDTVCCTASRHQAANSESKFIPNPSAQPFVPKWNSSPSEQLNNYLPQNVDGESGHEISKTQPGVDKPLDTMNGVNSAIPPSITPFKHIALHLLSKVLDDETIFSLEDSHSTGETLLPLTVDPTCSSSCSPGDVSFSWPSVSPYPSPDCGIDSDQQLSSSIPGEHIWQSSDVNHNTSMTMPITTPTSMPPGRGWATQSPISPHGKYPPRGENGTALMNGYENLPSPQISSSVESLGNGSYYNSQFCSPTIPDEWANLSDSETNYCGEFVDHGSFDYSRVSPVHPPIGLICVSGSWPQNGQTCQEYSPNGKTEADSHPKNGYCHSWKGSEFVDFRGTPVQYRRSISSKSDDDSWIGRGKESLTSPSCSRPTPSNELHLRLDQCYEQLRYLEKERRKAELDICKFWPTKRISSSGSISAGRPHHSPSRVDRLLIDVQKEHGKVEALVGRIERIRHSPLNINISESVDEMMACIRRLQSCRKDEISSLGGRSKHGAGPRSPDGRDIVSLVSAVRDLALRERGCRTAVWCASQLVLSEMTKMTVAVPKSRRTSSNSESGIESPGSPAGGIS